MNQTKKQCTRCLLSEDKTYSISFDTHGLCNYCQYYDSAFKALGDNNQRKFWIDSKVDKIKKEGRNKPYDCILGVSGGVDSTYMAFWAKQQGLRPLLVHFDNGWNSELATKNIESICEKLGYELSTYVINWDEFRELQLAYLRAGVIDIEVLTDHAIAASIYRIAKKYGLRYTLNGNNLATEAIMPKEWVFDKSDWSNIKDIYYKYGSGKPIRTFPHINFAQKLYYHWFLKLESIEVLNYIDYNKQVAKEIIISQLNWKDYGGKHYESVFTKFYQAYILPVKFGVDKRIAHNSNLICSGQITKSEATKEIDKPLYLENSDLKAEKDYVLKKFQISEKEFDEYMNGVIRKHSDFKTEKHLWEKYFQLIDIIKFKFLRKSKNNK